MYKNYGENYTQGLVVRGACTPDFAPSCGRRRTWRVGGEAVTRSALATPRRVAPHIVYIHDSILFSQTRPQAKIRLHLSLW